MRQQFRRVLGEQKAGISLTKSKRPLIKEIEVDESTVNWIPVPEKDLKTEEQLDNSPKEPEILVDTSKDEILYLPTQVRSQVFTSHGKILNMSGHL